MNDYEIAQIGPDWQEGIFAEPLTGDEEKSVREYINGRLREWRIDAEEEYLNFYICLAWAEWTISTNNPFTM